VRLAIASNFDQRLFDVARQIEPLQTCHPVLVSSQVGYRKPHPQFFEVVRTAVGVAPNSVLYVGDDPDNDIAAARLAGFQTLLIRRQGSDGLGEAASLVKVLQLAGCLESDTRDA
jgi:putative hydrolase of the HAD superfamily